MLHQVVAPAAYVPTVREPRILNMAPEDKLHPNCAQITAMALAVASALAASQSMVLMAEY
jgi:hypothetical protein